MNFKEIESYSKIYIYGYSNMGRNVYKRLKILFPQKKIGMVVSKYNEKTKKLKTEGSAIFEIKEIKGDAETLVILALNPLYHKKILEILKEIEVKVLIYDEEIDDEINKRIEKLPGLEVRLLNICVGQACNFRCKDCANLAPYANKQNMKYSFENIKKDIDAILPYFSVIDTLHIQGGETFLYSELDKLLYFLVEKYGHIFRKIQIATNGTVIPRKRVINALKETKAEVRISDYAVKDGIEQFECILRENEIRFKKYRFIGQKGNWSYSGGVNDVDLYNQNLLEHIQRCGWHSCYTVENGIVGRCARSIPAITLQNMEVGDDYLDLSKENTDVIVGKYFMFIQPMKCCNKCMGSNGKVIPAAVQIQE